MLTLPRSSTILRLVPALVWMGLIFILSSQQTVPAPPGIAIGIASFIGHLLLYFVLAFLLALPFITGRRISARSLVLVAVLAELYGVSDEIHQSFVPGRDASLVDAVTDLIGALLAAMMLDLALNRGRG